MGSKSIGKNESDESLTIGWGQGGLTPTKKKPKKQITKSHSLYQSKSSPT